MKFTVSLPIGGPIHNVSEISTLATKADQLGFDAVTASERIIMPRNIKSKYPYGPKGKIPGVGTSQNTLELLSVMSYIAAKTKNISLVPTVIVLPYRNPIIAAKILATIDQLSNGRLVVGCGVGWNLEEAQTLMVPTPFNKRGTVSDEYIMAWKELWSKENPEFRGEFLEIYNVDFSPKTVQQPSPPFWAGGESPAAIRRAAQLCDGWLPSDSNPLYPLNTAELFKIAVYKLRNMLEDQNRNPYDFVIRFGAVPWDGDIRKTEMITDSIRFWSKIGVTHQSLELSGSLSEKLELLDSFASEIFPLVND